MFLLTNIKSSLNYPCYPSYLELCIFLMPSAAELQIEGVFAFLTQRKWVKTPPVLNRCVTKTPTEPGIDAS